MKDVPIGITTVDGTYRILQLFFKDIVISTTEYKIMMKSKKGKSVPLQARDAQRVPGILVPRLRDNGPGWW